MNFRCFESIGEIRSFESMKCYCLEDISKEFVDSEYPEYADKYTEFKESFGKD